MWLLTSAGYLNLGASLIVFLAGASLLFFRPKLFAQQPFTETAFNFWILAWAAFVLLWLYNRNLDASPPLLLLLVDIQTVLAMGFFLSFWQGADFRPKQSILKLCVVYLLLVVWNLSFAGWAVGTPQGSSWRTGWAFASGVLSVTTFSLIAVVLVWRYRGPGILFVFVTLAYLILQRPAYLVTFGTVNTSADLRPWLVLLAFWKVLYGAVFLLLYFMPARTYAPIHLPPWGLGDKPILLTVIRWFLVLILGEILKLLITDALRLTPLDGLMRRIFEH